MPDSITRIGDNSFNNCYNLTELVLPKNLTYIGEYAFAECTSLSGITIPKGVSYIGKYAFYRCHDLTDVYYAGSEADWRRINIDYSEYGNEWLLCAKIHYNHAT